MKTSLSALDLVSVALVVIATSLVMGIFQRPLVASAQGVQGAGCQVAVAAVGSKAVVSNGRQVIVIDTAAPRNLDAFGHADFTK